MIIDEAYRASETSSNERIAAIIDCKVSNHYEFEPSMSNLFDFFFNQEIL